MSALPLIRHAVGDTGQESNINNDVITQKNPNPPRAVCIVFGHLGSSISTLEKYAKYYTDRNCHVVATTSPPNLFMKNASLRSTTLDAIIQAGKLLQDATPENNNNTSVVPLVVHSFSNGGAFLLENMYIHCWGENFGKSLPPGVGPSSSASATSSDTATCRAS